MWEMRKPALVLLLIFGLCCIGFSQPGNADYPQDYSQKIYIIPVKGVIDLGLSAFIKRSLEEAKESLAEAVILEIDSFGGRVDAAVEITGALQRIKPIPTVAFIEGRAVSAGALIALACQRIIMSPGSSIGSAEPRAMGFTPGKEEITDEKTVSVIRAEFQAMAEANKHPVNLALAMVDSDYEIKLVKIKGQTKILTAEELERAKEQYPQKDIRIIKTVSPQEKLLNITAGEAKEYGLAQELLINRSEVIDYLGLSSKTIVLTRLTWSEGLVRFFTHPLISPLLLSLGFLGLLFELRMPGWGVSGTLGILFLALFFWGHYLVGLAGWTELVILSIGVFLLFAEIFLIPGFGIAGVSGIILILTGIFLSLVKHPLSAPRAHLIQAFYTLSFAIIITFVGIILSWKLLPKTGLWKRIILNFAETKKNGFQSAASLEAYLGKTGKTLSVLRPSGRAIIEGKPLDVITEGEFIDKDRVIKVIKVEGSKITVTAV